MQPLPPHEWKGILVSEFSSTNYKWLQFHSQKFGEYDIKIVEFYRKLYTIKIQFCVKNDSITPVSFLKQSYFSRYSVCEIQESLGCVQIGHTRIYCRNGIISICQPQRQRAICQPSTSLIFLEKEYQVQQRLNEFVKLQNVRP